MFYILDGFNLLSNYIHSINSEDIPYYISIYLKTVLILFIIYNGLILILFKLIEFTDVFSIPLPKIFKNYFSNYIEISKDEILLGLYKSMSTRLF